MSTSLESRNEVFDEIVDARRSIRAFTGEMPTRGQIDSILAAGLKAPFAKAAIGDATNFRRFIIFPKDSRAVASLTALIREKGKAQLEALEGQAPEYAPFRKRLEALASGRLPGLGTAPYLIAVAELKGLPRVEQQSLAHCLENMWLKATALNLGFHLVTALAMLEDEPRFWELCGLPRDRYAVNGCAIGVPVVQPPPTPRPALDEAAIWMS